MFVNGWEATAVVPGYYLVCYNIGRLSLSCHAAVVPGYYLVCYNIIGYIIDQDPAVVPGYYLVCYNSHNSGRNAAGL